MHSTVTSKGKVTIPQVVRRVMSIKPGDRSVFHIQSNKLKQQITLALQPTLTLEQTFASVKPVQKPEDFKRLREIALQEKVEHELTKTNKWL